MKLLVRVTVLASCLIAAATFSRCGGVSHPPAPLTIATPSLPNGTLGALYSQTIQATGGVAPFAWAVSVGGLPHNLRLAPSAGNAVKLSGMPDTAAQAIAFSIKVTDSANQSATQSYTVSILGEPDTLGFSPATGLSFSAQLVGAASPSQVATLTNSGSSAVVINSVAATGSNGGNDFSQTNTCGSSSSLAPGADCTISVTFTPSQFGPRPGMITITDDTVGSPHVLSLTGTGLTSGPNASLSASSLTFGGELVGTTSPASSITLNNYGTTTLDITSITTTTSFADINTCAASLASVASCTINVTFTPTTVGSVNGTLSVTDNAPGNPQTVSLSGSGTTNQDTLTGYCWSDSRINNICQLVRNSNECPAGQQAISPRMVSLGCFFPHGSRLVDVSRPCGSSTAQGYCAVATRSSASGAAAR